MECGEAGGSAGLTTERRVQVTNQGAIAWFPGQPPFAIGLPPLATAAVFLCPRRLSHARSLPRSIPSSPIPAGDDVGRLLSFFRLPSTEGGDGAKAEIR